MIRQMCVLIAIILLFPITAFADDQTVSNYHAKLISGYKFVRANSQSGEIKTMNERAFGLANDALAINTVICANPENNIKRIHKIKREIVSIANEMDKKTNGEFKKSINDIRHGAVLMHMKAKHNYLFCIGLEPQ